MILLHTSDWHLGMPVGNSNYREDQLFFTDELVRVIREEQAGAVIVAGDVFDSGKVSGEAIEIWNRAARKAVYVKGKGFNKPLFDTGTLYDAFGYEIED